MSIGRRAVLGGLSALAMGPSGTDAQTGVSMYGLIVKIKSAAGKREELIPILTAGATGMPGCLSYVVAKDATDPETIWITEVWESVARHEASLTLPAVRESIQRGRPLIAGFERVAVTQPVPAGGNRREP